MCVGRRPRVRGSRDIAMGSPGSRQVSSGISLIERYFRTGINPSIRSAFSTRARRPCPSIGLYRACSRAARTRFVRSQSTRRHLTRPRQRHAPAPDVRGRQGDHRNGKREPIHPNHVVRCSPVEWGRVQVHEDARSIRCPASRAGSDHPDVIGAEVPRPRRGDDRRRQCRVRQRDPDLRAVDSDVPGANRGLRPSGPVVARHHHGESKSARDCPGHGRRTKDQGPALPAARYSDHPQGQHRYERSTDHRRFGPA